jgi:hypothetical protein
MKIGVTAVGGSVGSERARFASTLHGRMLDIVDEIAVHHREHPDWLSLTEPL